jgi:hypothetical protein
MYFPRPKFGRGGFSDRSWSSGRFAQIRSPISNSDAAVSLSCATTSARR